MWLVLEANINQRIPSKETMVEEETMMAGVTMGKTGSRGLGNQILAVKISREKRRKKLSPLANTVRKPTTLILGVG